ncbi:hypothetical protein H6G93_16835 [Nostoc sp. FACHB-973]|nr:hypothetical protein [Nostoc sp. FACHB-973]MBX9252710.1 hypothetical protein [Desmonostoc muscorum CCALA 125]
MALSFSDVEQSVSLVPDCIDARTSRNGRKITGQGLALLKGNKGDRIQNSPSLSLKFRIICWHENERGDCTEMILSRIQSFSSPSQS